MAADEDPFGVLTGGAMENNRQVTLAARPVGVPKESDFGLVDTPVAEPAEGQFLVRTNYASVDPYMRGLIARADSYAGSVAIGDVVPGGAVGTVIASRHAGYEAGQVVQGQWGWQEYAVSDGADVRVVDASLAPVSTALGVLGMPGLTAYFGLLEIGRPKEGETVFVSAAAGAVGSVVGQIAKIMGCRAAGSAGSEQKVRWVLDELGFDCAFDYRATDNWRAAVRRACPRGVDVYFDNVGGTMSDTVIRSLNTGGRIVACGQIGQYNATEQAVGPRLLWQLIVKQARAEGFLVSQFAERYEEARRRMAEWLRAGRLKYRETIVDGIENAPRAFLGLFSGENVGKMLVRVGPDE
jgi:NADPH-dependent curcumin reductase CurA